MNHTPTIKQIQPGNWLSRSSHFVWWEKEKGDRGKFGFQPSLDSNRDSHFFHINIERVRRSMILWETWYILSIRCKWWRNGIWCDWWFLLNTGFWYLNISYTFCNLHNIHQTNSRLFHSRLLSLQKYASHNTKSCYPTFIGLLVGLV